MIASLPFASCYVYSPSGACPSSARSRLLCMHLKNGDAHLIRRYVARVSTQSSECPRLARFFGADVILVPVPASAPDDDAGNGVGGASVPAQLAAAMVRAGLGGSAWGGLRRVRAVPRSSASQAGARPSVCRHYDSFAIDCVDPLPAHAAVVLVDDVVTKGRTLLAAASRLQDSFPHISLRAFAMLRTMGLCRDVARLLDPCVGAIEWRAGDARRQP